MVTSRIAHPPVAEWLGCARLPHGAEGELRGEAADVESLVRNRVARMLMLALGLLGLWSFAAPPGVGQATEIVRGRVFNETEVDGDRVREPVEGVTITVTAAEGGEAIGGARLTRRALDPAPRTRELRGHARRVVLARRGTPGGQPQRAAVNVRPGENQAHFFLGEDLRRSPNRWYIPPTNASQKGEVRAHHAITPWASSLIYGTTD